MDDYKFYAHKYLYSSSHSTELWKVNRKLNYVANEDGHRPRLSAYIGLSEDLDDRIPKSSKYERCGKISQETFNKCWNESFAFLQKARLHDGEYYMERQYSGSYLVFHAFFRAPSMHYKITCWRDVEYARIDIGAENSIMYRRGIANRILLQFPANRAMSRSSMRVIIIKRHGSLCSNVKTSLSSVYWSSMTLHQRGGSCGRK